MISILGGFKSSAPAAIEETQQTVFSVAHEYICTSSGMQNMVVQPLLKGIKWIEWGVIEGLSETGKASKDLLGKASHGLFWVDVPGKVKKLGKSIIRLKDSLSEGALLDISFRSKKVFIKSALLTDFLSGTIKIFQNENVIQLSQGQIAILSTIGFLGSFALFLQAVSGLQKQVNKFIHAEIGSPEFKLAAIRVLSRSCLVAIAVFVMIAFWFGQIIAQFILLAVSSLFTLLVLSGHFYEKLYVKKQEKTVDV